MTPRRVALSLRECAESSGLSYDSIRAAVNEGRLRATYPNARGSNRGGKALVLVRELERFIDESLSHVERAAR